MANVLEQAKERAKALRAQATELEEYIREVEETLSVMMGTSHSVAGDDPFASSTDEVIEGAVAILREHGNRPMSSSTLFALLSAKGIVVAGQEPERNLSTKLSREAARSGARLKSLGRGNGYQLADSLASDDEKLIEEIANKKIEEAKAKALSQAPSSLSHILGGSSVP